MEPENSIVFSFEFLPFGISKDSLVRDCLLLMYTFLFILKKGSIYASL